MTEPDLTLTRAQRQRLLTALADLPVFQTIEGRALLLNDLPPALVRGVGRSTTISVDLDAIIRAVEGWGALDDGTPALLVLLENALFHGRGGNAGRDLKALRTELTTPATATPLPSVPNLPPAMARTDLTPADPATVLIVSHPNDAGAVAELATAWRLRGLRVRWSQTEEPLPVGQGLAGFVARGCDAVVFYVGRKGWETAGWWEPAAQAALARQAVEATFAIVPLLPPMGAWQAKAQTAVEVFTPLQPLSWQTPIGVGGRPLHARVLRGALAGRMARAQAEAQGLVVSFHTFPYSAAAEVLHLDCDWTALFAKGDPDPASWQAQLQPALDDVHALLARQQYPVPLTVWLKARLSAAVALAYRFPPKGSVPVRWINPEGMTVSSTGPPGPADDLRITRTLLTEEGAERAVLLEIAVARTVPPAVDAWLTTAPAPPRWRLTAAPVDGASRQAITAPEQARAWAWCIGDTVRELWDHSEADAVWLFVAGPVEFAALLGQQLYSDTAAQHPILVYAFSNNAYTLACVLGRA